MLNDMGTINTLCCGSHGHGFRCCLLLTRLRSPWWAVLSTVRWLTRKTKATVSKDSTMELNRCFVRGLKALFVLIHCIYDVDPAKSTAWQLHSITTILPSCFTSEVISKLTFHSLSPAIFIHHRISTTYPYNVALAICFQRAFSLAGRTFR